MVNYIYDAVFSVYNALFQVQYNCSGLSNATGLPVCAMKNITSEQLSVIIKTSSFEGRTGRVAFIGNNPVSKSFPELKQ